MASVRAQKLRMLRPLATYAVPLGGSALWLSHLLLSLTGTGSRRVRQGARWGCLVLMPLAIVGTYVWWAVFVPNPECLRVYCTRFVDEAAMVNIFGGGVLWVVFASLEPAVMAIRRER